MLTPALGRGATYVVPGDFPTIQEAILGAADGSTILVSPGVYPESILAQNLNKDLYLLASGGPAATAIDGSGTNALLEIGNSAAGNPLKNLVFDGFTFRNGRAGDDPLGPGSPVVVRDARPVFLNCVFSGNVSTAWGGAVLVRGLDAAPSFVNCVFRDNHCLSSILGRGGGAVRVNSNAQAYFKGCLFEGNSSTAGLYGAGGAVFFQTSGGVIQDCVFRGNGAAYAGGAVMVISSFDNNPQAVEVRGSRFEGNSCLHHSVFSRPEPSEGGAIMAESNVTVTVTGSFFAGNVAESGGGIHSYRANLAIADSVFDGNVANGTDYLGYGGAIGVNLNDAADVDRREATVLIERSMIRNSTAPVGGGIFFQGDVAHAKNGALTLRDVTIDSCRATTAGHSYGVGGGMYLVLATVRASGTSILRDLAETTGGGISIQSGSSLSMDSGSLVVGNSAVLSAPAIHNPGSAPLSLGDTVVAFNDGDATAAATRLAPTPRVTVGGKAHLTYFVAPRPAVLELDPVGLDLPDEAPGGAPYAAGSAVVPGVDESAVFALSSHPAATAAVEYTANGLTDIWFGAAPHATPGVVEAEDYDRGGDRVAFFDRTATNDGADPYRAGDAVDIFPDPSASQGRAVGLTEAGEWLDYTVSSGADALYDLWAGLVAGPAGGEFYVQVDGEDVTGRVQVPDTGGASPPARTLIQGTGVFLAKGQHLVRVVIVRGGFSLDYLEWTIAGTKSLLSLAASPSVANPGDTIALTGTLTGWPQGGSPAPLAGVLLTLEFRTDLDAAWTELAVVETAPDGSFSTAHAPSASTTYRAVWSGALIGGEEYPPATVSVRVPFAPLVTLELRGYRSIRRGLHLYSLGSRVRILGTVEPTQYPGEVRVRIERRTRTGWKQVADRAKALNIASAYRLRWKPKRPGKYRLSAIFAGADAAAPGLSEYRNVRVR